ncbi:MAG TPA: xanthine dehydrogenase family protein molybdopterin-binding subunit [Gemmatimonadales bacterium]
MIGDPINRIDGRLKITGAARYTGDNTFPNLAWGVIVQSTIGHGSISAMDTVAAAAAPGVIAILTPDNAPRLPRGGEAGVNPPSGRKLSLLQTKDVRYNGEPIALVIAESFEQASHAAALVRVTYRALAPVAELDAALHSARPVTDRILGRIPPSYRRGDVDAGLAAAHARVSAVYRTPLETHNAMEPHATIASWDGDDLLLLDSTQYVFGVKRFVAKTLGVDEARVRVVAKFTGGAFGSKGSPWSHVLLAAMAARQVHRPVKVVLSRRQMFGLVGGRPWTVQELSLGAAAGGKLTAIRHIATTSTSAFEDWVEPSTLQTRMLYAVPALETSQKLVSLNVGTPTFNRGPGESSGTFALESALDELAEQLGMDPIALRQANYAETDPESGHPWSSKSLRECYQLGAERFGWARRQRPRQLADGDTLIGMGVASATYPTRRSPASALARLQDDGTILVQAATHELGTGTYTVMSQIAAEALGVPVDRVHFELGDTLYPENPISAGSMTAASTGSAVHAAAMALKDRITQLGGNPTDAAAARDLIARAGGTLEARGDSRSGDEEQHFSMHAFGAVFCEVRVDRDLGQIKVSRLLGAYGVGRVLNAKTARSQLMGGIVYGLGMALTERTAVDGRTGRYMNADLAEYLVPVNADVPEIDILFADEHDDKVNPIGVKGIGEIGTTGVAASVANAVYNATGIRVRDLPISIDTLLLHEPRERRG